MTLRTKTLLGALSVLVALIGLLGLLLSWIVLGSFARLETSDAQRDSSDAVLSLRWSVTGLRATASAYSVWDDAWAFVGSPNRSFIDTNLPRGVCASLGLNLLVFADTDGKVVWAQGQDLVTGAPMPLPAGLLRTLRPGGVLHRDQSPDAQAAGLLVTPGMPVLVAAHAIVRSTKQGRVRGTLVLGRCLDSHFTSQLRQEHDRVTTLAALNATAIPADLAEAGKELVSARAGLAVGQDAGAPSRPDDGDCLVKARGPKVLSGYGLLNDLRGRPALVLRTDTPRAIHREAMGTFGLSMACLVLLGLAAGLTNVLLLDRTVLSRLSRFRHELARVTQLEDATDRIEVSGRDELAVVERAVNEMLGRLQESHLRVARSEVQLRLLTDHVNDVIWTTDTEGRFTYASASAQRMLGYSHGELYLHPLEHAMTPESARRCREVLRELLESQDPTRKPPSLSLQVEQVRKDGSTVWTEVRPCLLHDAEGKVVGLAGSTRDVTQWHHAQQALERALNEAREARDRVEEQARLLAVQAEDLAASRDQAQAASQAKSDFLANMSHEIRTPMNGVLGMADLLLETPLSTQQRSFAQTIQESARSLLDLLGGLLDLSKIEAGRLELESVEMDLRELLDSLLDLFALSAEAKGVTLACLVDPGVPNLVRGDPGRLRQILINLVGNALKFTDSGSVTVEVSVTETSLASVGLRFAVADTGIGIRPQQVEALFEAFTQADASTTRRFGGTGLGLTISRHLVDLMGGEIGAEGRPGQGSTFWFTLELPLAAPESPGRHPYAELEGVPVLVVSAEMLVRRSLELTLLGLGCQPAVVGTEADAIECLALAQSRGKPFRAVLLDEGSEREGRKGGPSLLSPGTPLAGAPVVLLTSLANQAAAPREASSGQAWTLSKPIRAHLTAGTLVAAVSGPGRAASTPTQEPVGLSLAGVRILLVEDNLINQQVARCMLERLGCASEVAANGQEALDLLSRERYDAVLMDCQMPEMDGYEASRALRAREAATGEHALVIAMTANAMHGDRERCLDAGMDDYISKPLETHRIRQVLSHWIASSRREAPVGDRPRATEPAQQSVFDLEGLTNRAGPEVELHRRLVSLFLRDVPGKAAALRQAIRDDRSSDAREAAHAIKGMAATLGAPGISRAAAGLEQALLQAPPSGLPELLESLEVEWQHFRSHDEVQRLVEG